MLEVRELLGDGGQPVSQTRREQSGADAGAEIDHDDFVTSRIRVGGPPAPNSTCKPKIPTLPSCAELTRKRSAVAWPPTPTGSERRKVRFIELYRADGTDRNPNARPTTCPRKPLFGCRDQG